MAKLSKELAVEAIKGIEDNEVFLFTAPQYSELLDNYKKTAIDAFEKDRVTEIYRGIDKDFANAIGIKKPDTDEVKTYKFWPEEARKLKEKAEAAEVELNKLKAGGSPDLLKEIEALRKASIEKDNEWKLKMAQITTELTVKDIKNQLDASTRDLKLSNLPKPVVDTFIESAKTKLSQSAKMVDGQMIFVDSDGNPRINKETFKPYTASELMALELEPIIEKGKEAKGGGSVKPSIIKGKDGKIEVSLIVPTSVRTKTELTKFLIESGLPMNTDDFYAAYDKYSESLPI